ncbi:MAG: protein kinase [bacterium]|nr:protein kinase [bacterium]
MPLAAGQSFFFYEILGSLGAGAMGEVNSAKDTRLDREVAIKVLPEHFAEDEERLRRFEREAKSLASLNHPNVAQIFGVDQGSGPAAQEPRGRAARAPRVVRSRRAGGDSYARAGRARRSRRLGRGRAGPGALGRSVPHTRARFE